MNILKELKEKIADTVEEYRVEKISIENLDSDREFEIYKEIQYTLGNINDRLDELDSTIDAILEDEPSLWEQDYKEDCRQRTMDLIGR